MLKATPLKVSGVRMRVSPEERRLLLARRGAEPERRPQVIDGYREPSTVAELIELFRVFLTTNFGYLVDAFPDEHQRLEIQGSYGLNELPHTAIVFAEDDFGGEVERLLKEKAHARRAVALG